MLRLRNLKFSLLATVSTEDPKAVGAVLETVIGSKGTFASVGEKEFQIRAEMEGESAKDLNRSLMSQLRRAEKKTRLRAEWTHGDVTERFFDYVFKKRSENKR